MNNFIICKHCREEIRLLPLREDSDPIICPNCRHRVKEDPPPVPGKPIVGLVAGGIILLGVILALVIWLSGSRKIPDKKWQEVSVPNRFKALLPGPATTQSQTINDFTVKVLHCSPDPDQFFAVLYSEGLLPQDRLKLPAETILNDCCSSAMVTLRSQQHATELGRSSIQLGNHPGKQIVIDVPKVPAQFIYRYYLIYGRLYGVMAGGTHYRENNPNLIKLFESFTSLEKPVPEDIPAQKWKIHTISDAMSVKLPGTPNRVAHQFDRLLLPILESRLDEVLFQAGAVQDIPTEYDMLSRDVVFKEMADKNLNFCRLQDPRTSEMSRKPIQLGKEPGFEQTIQMPLLQQTAVVRIYLTENRLYFAQVAGRGITSEHSSAKTLFDSMTPVPGKSSEKLRGKLTKIIEPPVDFRLSSSRIIKIGFSRDGKILARVREDNFVEWIEMESKRILDHTPKGNPTNSQGCTISPDGNRVAFARVGTLVYIVDRDTKKEQTLNPGQMPHNALCWYPDFSKDGQLFCMAIGEDGLRIWNVKDGMLITELEDFPKNVNTAAISHDRQWLVTGSTHLSIWNLKTKKKIIDFGEKEIARFGGLHLSPDGKMLAALQVDGIQAWSLDVDVNKNKATVEAKPPMSLVGYPKCLAFSPDSKYMVAVINQYDQIGVWDAKSFKKLGNIDLKRYGHIVDLSFCESDRLLGILVRHSSSVPPKERILFMNLDEQKWH